MTSHWVRPFLLTGALVFFGVGAGGAEPTASEFLIPWLLDHSKELESVPFAEVVAATSGKRIIPFDAKDADDVRILHQIGVAMDAVLIQMNLPASGAQKAGRINEASHFFEDALRDALARQKGFTCDFPRTADGAVLRSGYPDLRLVDAATGRVVYLDPKLYARGSAASTFRTFYFEPRRGTNKVNDDARHLIVGVEHEKTATGWNFRRWRLVDIARFKVRLKAEFEGSNADLYRPEATVRSSGE